MLKVAVIILTINLVFAGLYSLGLIITPQTFASETYKAWSGGQSLDNLQDQGAVKSIM